MAERIFKIKKCRRQPGDRPCLDFFMGRCLAPCLGKIEADEYRGIVRNVMLFLEGKSDELLKQLAAARDALELHPYLPLSRALYAQALELSGATEEALKQYRMATVICPDLPWLRALEALCLVNSGRRREALEILQQLEELRATEYVDGYFQALLLHSLGRKEEAFLELERAAAENSAALFVLDVDPRMDLLRIDPRFGQIRDRVFIGSIPYLPTKFSFSSVLPAPC